MITLALMLRKSGALSNCTYLCSLNLYKILDKTKFIKSRIEFEAGLGMGLAGTIKLKNPRLPNLAPVEIEALADTGAVHMCIPSHIQCKIKKYRSLVFIQDSCS